mgnify:CR=1 FL=1
MAKGTKRTRARTMLAFGDVHIPHQNPQAVEVFQSAGILYAPGKAANAGGVATSALEMSQNSMRYFWSFEEVDCKLRNIMTNLYRNVSSAAAEYGVPGDFVTGANVAGFLKVADSMLAYGLV